MSDDHSELEPPLPIPNRAVKRLSADDSADFPCESRTSSGTHKSERPQPQGSGPFVFLAAFRMRCSSAAYVFVPLFASQLIRARLTSRAGRAWRRRKPKQAITIRSSRRVCECAPLGRTSRCLFALFCVRNEV